MIEVTVDPVTLGLRGIPSGELSAKQVRELELPPCPVCETWQIQVDVINVTTAQLDKPYFAEKYLVGLWKCPDGCDPDDL